MNNGKDQKNNVPSVDSNNEVEIEIENLELDGDLKVDLTPDSNTNVKNDESSSTSNDLQDVSNDYRTNNEPENINDTNNVPESSNDTSDISDSAGEDKKDIGENLPSEQSDDSDVTSAEENTKPKEDNLPAENDKDEKKDVSNEENIDSNNSDKNQKEDTGKQNDSDDGEKDLKKDNKDLDKKDDNTPAKKDDNAPDKKEDNLPDKKENGDQNKNKPNENNPSKQGDKPAPKANEGAKAPGSKAPSKPSNSSGGNFKDRLRNGAKNAAERAKQRAGNAARDKVNNSKPMQAAQKAKNAADKAKNAIDNAKKGAKAVKKGAKVATKVAKATAKAAKGFIDLMISLSPWSWAVLAIIILLIVVICAIATIAGKDNVNTSSGKENYSEVDQKTLDKLNGYYENYPNADAALAMVTVIYPYYETLIDPNISNKLGIDENDYEKYEDTIEDEEDDEDSEEDCKDYECEEKTEDDMYLVLYRKILYRWKFKKLLRKSNSMSENEFDDYIVNKWMEQERGYKNILSKVSGDEREEIKKEILNDLKSQKEYFKNYIYDNLSCLTDSTSIGYSDAGGVLQGQGVVILKDTISYKFNDIKNAKTLYGTEKLNMSIKRYVMGVAYNEISSYIKKEAAAKSVMIASQSFLLGRTAPGSNDGINVGMGFKTEKKDGKTIFYMRANSFDQGFCDVYEGCDKNAGIYSHTNVEGTPSGDGVIYPKEVSVIGYPKLDAKSLKNLEKWYSEIAGEFVYDDKAKRFAGNQFEYFCNDCLQGHCLAHKEVTKLADQNKDYKYILYSKMYYDKRYVSYNMDTKTLSAENSECTPISSDGACGIPDEKFIYYSQDDYASTQFCGRSGASISSSGCGVTSMAMIISNLTDTKVTPPDTMREAYGGGFCGYGIDGTNFGYFSVAAKKHGLTYKSLAVSTKGAEDALSTLKSGGLIIANVGAASPFTSGGHYIVIRKVDANNKVYVGDPKHKNLYKVPYSINDFVNKGWITHGWWAFTSNKSKSIVEQYCKSADGDGISTGSMSSPIKGQKPYCGNYPSYPGHTGIDMSVSVGTPVYAVDGGTVSISKDLTGCDGRCCVGGYYSYGRYIEIKHANGLSSLYAHLSSREVKEGQKVSKGQLIGKSGANGNTRSSNGCNGPHLHFEVKKNGSPINPCTYMK